jgi:hypothetical protein
MQTAQNTKGWITMNKSGRQVTRSSDGRPSVAARGTRTVDFFSGTLGLNTEPILLYYSPEPSCANDPMVLAL